MLATHTYSHCSVGPRPFWCPGQDANPLPSEAGKLESQALVQAGAWKHAFAKRILGLHRDNGRIEWKLLYRGYIGSILAMLPEQVFSLDCANQDPVLRANQDPKMLSEHSVLGARH